MVAIRFNYGGTREGEMGGIPPTGKHVSISGMSVARFEGGKIAEMWSTWDTLGYLQQLGLIPPLGEG
jgi:predicted ester cyclase